MTASDAAARAYAALDPTLTSPARAEARVFARVTRRLEAGADRAGPIGPDMVGALHDNRRLWAAAAMAAADDANAMPAPLRAQILSLAGFVDRRTSAVLSGGATVRPLTEINRRVAAGLSGVGV